MKRISGITAYIAVGFLAGALTLSTTSAPANRSIDNPVRDGNWWHQQQRDDKIFYMAGFAEGMDLGNKWSYWGIDKKSQSCELIVDMSFTKYWDKYFAHVKIGQIVDGLDAFYEDYRNRSITSTNAVWIVLNEIAGRPRAEMDKMIEVFRRNPRL